MSFLFAFARRLLRKAGYTLTWGDIRKVVLDQTVHSLPPAHLFRNTRVCRDRSKVRQCLPTGGTSVEVDVAYGDFTRRILEVLKPDHFIAIATFDIRRGHEPWGIQHLRNNQHTRLEYDQKQFASCISAGAMILKEGLSWDMLAGPVDRLPVHRRRSQLCLRKKGNRSAPFQDEGGRHCAVQRLYLF